MFTTIGTQYYDNSPYVETINAYNLGTNATFLDCNKYYSFIKANPLFNDRDFIFDLYGNGKSFGKEEQEAEKKIIESMCIPMVDNLMDLYE